MSDEQPGPSKPKQKSDMTIAEYLSLPENQNANLVMPIPWCPHLQTISKNFDVKDYDVKRLCEICKNEGENWICLVCHKVFCSRYVNEHMVIHSAEAQHLVTLSFSDISVWCYGCEDYVDNECLYEKKNALHKNKFNGEEMPKKSCSALVME
jgi:histone deacetylase 6